MCRAGDIAVQAPGAILSFHAYNHQDHDAHGRADTRQAFMRAHQQPGNVVDAGRALERAREQRMSWAAVQPLVDCLLALERPDAIAGPGEFATASGKPN